MADRVRRRLRHVPADPRRAPERDRLGGGLPPRSGARRRDRDQRQHARRQDRCAAVLPAPRRRAEGEHVPLHPRPPGRPDCRRTLPRRDDPAGEYGDNGENNARRRPPRDRRRDDRGGRPGRSPRDALRRPASRRTHGDARTLRLARGGGHPGAARGGCRRCGGGAGSSPGRTAAVRTGAPVRRTDPAVPAADRADRKEAAARRAAVVRTVRAVPAVRMASGRTRTGTSAPGGSRGRTGCSRRR